MVSMYLIRIWSDRPETAFGIECNGMTAAAGGVLEEYRIGSNSDEGFLCRGFIGGDRQSLWWWGWVDFLFRGELTAAC